jgi:hypothetical protein
MSDAPAYYHLVSSTMLQCHLTHDARDAAQSWTCNSCSPPNAGIRAVDVRLQDRIPRGKPMNFVYTCGVPLVHREPT